MKRIRKSIAIVLGSLVLSTSAFASTVNLGTLSSSKVEKIAFGTGPFDFDYTFTLAEKSSFAAIESDVSVAGFLTGNLTLFTNPSLSAAIQTISHVSFSGTTIYTQAVSLIDTLAAGNYTLRLSGTSTGAGGGSVTLAAVSAVPEPATWAMMLTGFAGMGFFASRKLRGQQSNALAA